MKLKDFFYFSKIQQAGIIILLSLIFLTLLGGILMPYILPKKDAAVDKAFLSEAKAFKNTLKDKEPAWKNYDKKTYRDNYTKKEVENTRYQLFTFDPNTADSATFLRLGLKPYIAKNILKYRGKGGKFRTPESFANVYGITPEKYEELKPYIHIKELRKPQEMEKTAEMPPPTTNAYHSAKKEGIVLELNSADTADLKQIKGIGTSFAKKIVGYKNVLGGYSSVEQLKEVYGMRPEMYEQIRASFTVNPALIRKIEVNKASIERLKAHPYLRSFEKSKSLYEYRRKKVKLKSIDELKTLDVLTEEDIRKLTPYLSFE